MPQILEPFIYAIILLGIFILYFLISKRAAQTEQKLQSELQAERLQVARLDERVAAFSKEEQEQKQEVVELQNILKDKQQELLTLSIRCQELETRLEEERQQAQEKLAVLQEAEQKLGSAFKALASEALQANSQQFFQVANEKLKQFETSNTQELELRKEAIQQLVKPMQEGIAKFDEKLNELEQKRVGAYEGLKQQVTMLYESQKQLQGETTNLVKALRAPQVRGRWGEIQLRRVVELAGMIEKCDFDEQVSQTAEDGTRLRPDLIVHLPGGKTIVVDAKAPLQSYLDAVQAETEEKRQILLKDHARQLKTHVTQLSAKTYWNNFTPTPEFVILFVPGEVFYSAALEQEPSLIEFGAESRVLIATPTTLIALLRAVAYGWRQESLAKNAEQISKLGAELHERIVKMSEYFTDIGKAIKKASEAYNRTLSTLESRVLVSARRFEELEASKSDVIIADTEPLDVAVREI